MFSGSWGSVATGSGGGGTWGSGGGGGTWGAPSGGGGTWGSAAAPAPASGGGGTWGGIVAAPVGGYVGSAPYVLPGSGGGSFGPWGEGVYTPLDWPPTRFVRDNERLDDLGNAASIEGAGAVNLKTLAVVGLLLWALK